ncbi:MAG: hypothetical protein O3C21_14275 [Verrucomicrobia bacterium]|nr:hypothetical protein [Verrucomicrobiota bacterium]
MTLVASIGASDGTASDTKSSGTLVPIKRELLVLFGNDAREFAEDMGWPRDTTAARRPQTPLEWMGYELRYHNLLKEGKLKTGELSRYGGLIVDGSLHVPEVIEDYAAAAVIEAKAAGIPILVIGPYPFSSPEVSAKVARVLKLRGDGSVIRFPQTTGIVSLDPQMMNFEAEVRPRNVATSSLRAPEDADVFLSVIARAATGESARFDPVFLADWGGMVLDPYLEFQPSLKQTLLLVDLYKYLARIWPVGEFPAPDPTTRNGLRVFLSHIDGDGFASLSNLRGGATCGEIILERILKKYPVPVTASIVEANVRAHEFGQKAETAPELERIAREMFALPNVECATHTYSHPFVWLDGDLPYEEEYETRNLKLNPDVDYSQIDLEREIGGSSRYVQSLLPAGKKVELVLWSGNCQPGVVALRAAAKHQLGNMNGGDTVISRRYPGVAGVAPRIMYWDDQIQVLAPNQNDFVYTQDWQGTSKTGFSEVLETYQLTETPRRLKPVNVYYHFYSGALVGPLSALDRVYRWCMEQPLHAVTAGDFVRVTLDSHSTQVYQDGDRRWRLVNGGHLRTFRMPASAGIPLMSASSGVTGYHRFEDWFYIHTDGRAETVLQMGDSTGAERSLFLQKTTNAIEFETLSANSARFKQSGLREAETVFGGAEPGRDYELTIENVRTTVRATPDGTLQLRLPPVCSAVLNPL